MPYDIIRQDITKMKVDAIVNPTDHMFSGSGGTDARIHQTAGPELKKACDALPFLEEGEVAVTEGFRLPCKYIVHTVGPVWQGGFLDERRKLIACYRNAMQAACDRGCESIAFPLISSGTFGFPKDQVLRIALDTITSFLMARDMTVYVVVFDKKAYAISQKLQKDIQDFIDGPALQLPEDALQPAREAADGGKQPTGAAALFSSDKLTLEELLAHRREGFTGALMRLIGRSGMSPVQCYKKANITKQLFSKISSDPRYHPTRPTVFAFAIALKLTLEETEQLLNKAGLAFDLTDDTDKIVCFFIYHKKYDLNEINEVLDQHDLKCLGNITA